MCSNPDLVNSSDFYTGVHFMLDKNFPFPYLITIRALLPTEQLEASANAYVPVLFIGFFRKQRELPVSSGCPSSPQQEASQIPNNGIAARSRFKDPSLLGQEVKTLVNGVEQPGVKTAIWSGLNNAGHGLASGVYFYRLEARSVAKDNGSFLQVRKMILMK